MGVFLKSIPAPCLVDHASLLKKRLPGTVSRYKYFLAIVTIGWEKVRESRHKNEIPVGAKIHFKNCKERCTLEKLRRPFLLEWLTTILVIKVGLPHQVCNGVAENFNVRQDGTLVEAWLLEKDCVNFRSLLWMTNFCYQLDLELCKRDTTGTPVKELPKRFSTRERTCLGYRK